MVEFVGIREEEEDFGGEYLFDVGGCVKGMGVEGMYMEEEEVLEVGG